MLKDGGLGLRFELNRLGLLYTVSDVEELHLWMKTTLDDHPLFRRVSAEELVQLHFRF